MRSSASETPSTESLLLRAASLMLRDVLGQLVGVQERRHRAIFLGLLIAHDGHADAAVGMAAAGELAPLGVRPVDQIGEIGERAHEGDREPVAGGLAQPGLILHVVRQVRERVALGFAAIVRDGFVAAGEGNRLEAQERNLLGIVEREANHRAHLLIIDAVDDA